jgi:PAS domain S-box-containing protein
VQLFESLPIGVYHAAPDGRIVLANPYLLRLLGYPSVDALQRDRFCLERLHADPEQFRRELEANGTVNSLEAPFTNHLGRQLWMREHARVVFGDDGTLVGIEGTVEDITAHKQHELAARSSEERFRMLTEISAHYTYVYRVEPDGRFVCEWIGGDYVGITGYTPEEVDARGGWIVLHHPDDVAVGRERDRCIRSGVPSETEFRIRHRNGEWRWLHNIVKPVCDEKSGQVVRFYGATVDITQRKRAEEELRSAKDAAEAANRAKSALLANVSHELRTPLHGIIGTLELLTTTGPTPAQREYLGLARSSADLLLAIISDLLDIAKIEADKMELEAVGFSLRELVRSTLQVLELRIGGKNLELGQSVGDAVPDALIGDPTRLRQVLVNLVDNGIKFTERGQVEVAVSLAERPETTVTDACQLQFAVRDTGIGIAADQQARIFEAFAQADTSMSREYGGTGLGLHIAARLVQLMGGQLTVTSVPGQGSTFRFNVALRVQASSGATVPRLPVAAPAQQPRSLRVLVAEDNDINQRLIRDILQALGHSVDVVASGNDVLVALEDRVFDVIFMDVYMPRLDGLETTARIRQRETAHGGRVPIVGLTAHAVSGYKEICLNAGMDDYVSKPFRIRDITDVLERVTRVRNGSDS